MGARTILIAQAEAALQPEEAAFEEELTAYRNALLLHAFKERYINERLNTEVNEAEALSFYNVNRASFMLSDYAVRALHQRTRNGRDGHHYPGLRRGRFNRDAGN